MGDELSVITEKSLTACRATCEKFLQDAGAGGKVPCQSDDFGVCLERLRELEHTCNDLQTLAGHIPQLEQALGDIRTRSNDIVARLTTLEKDCEALGVAGVDAIRQELEHVQATSKDQAAELARSLQAAQRTETAVNALRQQLAAALAAP